MKKNAFTLIELLAVIVILAIVALIATPIILGIINDTKENANERSAENYLKAINTSIVSSALDNKKIVDGEYNILSNGNICLKYDNSDNDKCIDELPVEIEGTVSKSGTIIIKNGSVSDETTITIGGTSYEIVNNELKKVVEEGPEHLAKDNVRAVTESKTGIVPTVENGNIKPGSEFKIKVSDKILDEKGDIAEYTFFVLSNSEDGKYVNLIAEQNITIDGKFTSEPQDNDEWYVTPSNSYDNRYGPQTVYTYLSTATNNWTNLPIIEDFNYLDEGNQNNSSYGYQSIITSLDSSTGKYITTITPLSSSYGNSVTYENMRVRLPKYSEITATEVGCTYVPGSCPIWIVNYLFGNSISEPYYNNTNGKVNSTEINRGYWLLSSAPDSSSQASFIEYHGRVSYGNAYSDSNGIRPVITILKSDLLRVMK